LNCGTLQSIGVPTFEIIFAAPNPHVSSYLFTTPNPFNVYAHFIITNHIRQLSHDVGVANVNAMELFI
jgi:hypothetical protein